MSDYLTPSELPQPKLSRTNTGFTPNQIIALDTSIPESSKQIWKKHTHLKPFDIKEKRFKDEETKKITPLNDKEKFELEFIRNVEITLARNMYNCDNLGAYQAASNTIRDELLIDWANTQQKQTIHDGKRVYYLSLEFLMGRAMDNALINLKSREHTKSALHELGFNLEDVLDQEPDAALGNGGLGRLAACFVDSLSSKKLLWMGLRVELPIRHISTKNH